MANTDERREAVRRFFFSTLESYEDGRTAVIIEVDGESNLVIGTEGTWAADEAVKKLDRFKATPRIAEGGIAGGPPYVVVVGPQSCEEDTLSAESILSKLYLLS